MSTVDSEPRGQVIYYTGPECDGVDDRVRTDPRYHVRIGEDECWATYMDERESAPGWDFPKSADFRELRYEANQRIDTPAKAAIQAIVGILIDTFHETIEFTTIDGQHIADPHTVHMEEWGWMERRFKRIVEDYARTFPPRDEVQ